MLGQRDENEAATRIQAAYRGHTVRQSMNWPLPSGQTLGARFRTGEMIGDIVSSTKIISNSNLVTEDMGMGCGIVCRCKRPLTESLVTIVTLSSTLWN